MPGVHAGAWALCMKDCKLFAIKIGCPKQLSHPTVITLDLLFVFPKSLMNMLEKHRSVGKSHDNPFLLGKLFILTLCFSLVTIHAEAPFSFIPLLLQSQKSIG